MSRPFAEKVFAGQSATPDEWMAFLKEAHAVDPGMTSAGHEDYLDQEGFNSYQLLSRKILSLKPETQTLLDLACGDGFLISTFEQMTSRELDILGVDMSKDELALAQARKYKSNVRFKNETAGQISEKANSFDAVSCHLALMLMVPLPPIVKQIYQLLKPGGVFSFVVDGGPLTEVSQLFRKVRTEWAAERFPDFAGPQGFMDEHVLLPEGYQKLLESTAFVDISEEVINVGRPCSGNEIWDFYKTFYFISCLSEIGKQDLKNRFVNAAKTLANPQNQIDFSMNFRLCAARKPS